MPADTGVVYRAVIVQTWESSGIERVMYMGPYTRKRDAQARLSMAARVRWGWTFVRGHVETSALAGWGVVEK
jgi:hypothetical protein